jgi:hypothetical protein
MFGVISLDHVEILPTLWLAALDEMYPPADPATPHEHSFASHTHLLSPLDCRTLLMGLKNGQGPDLLLMANTS